jgi:indole-3-glycerol phosphate synthase/phosphoribosylanthranilate isomerase
VSAREAGADAALLILRDLDDPAARAFLGWADELALDVLVEAHDREELDRAVALDAQIVGVNARDLSTFAIDRRAQLELVARAPRDRVVVAESAVRSRAQAAAAELAGADGILVGTALMRARSPGAELAALLSRPLVKICGLTREEDVAAAAEAGADLAGFVLAESPRRAEAPLPVPETMLSVGVYVGESAEDGTDLVQLYPEEDGHRGREGVLLREGSEVARVLDLPWLGEDERHWETAARVNGRVLLAGGLSPENVGDAIGRVRPWAVDASRSLERVPGVKDHDRVRDFVAAARGGAQ